MKKKLLDRRGAAIELAIMMMVFSIFITTIILTTALLQNEHKTKAQLGIEQDIFLEQLGEDFVDAVINGNIGIWNPQYNNTTIPTVPENEKGHTWKELTIAPTCTEQGKTMQVCEDCGEQEVLETVSALGHTVAGMKCWETVSGECTICGQKNVTAQAKHNWGAWVDTESTNCIEDGSSRRDCENDGCEAFETKAILAGHRWSEWEEELTATCDTDGTRVHNCGRCEATEKENVSALGHRWDNGMVDPEANETTHGVMKYACELCDEEKNEEIHYWDEGSISVNQPCKNYGTKTYTCMCNTENGDECKATKTEELPLAPHSFENGICSVCGARRHNYVLTVMTAGKDAYKLYIQETESVLNTEEIPEETEPEVVEICGTVVLKIALEWEATSNVYKITEWSKK